MVASDGAVSVVRAPRKAAAVRIIYPYFPKVSQTIRREIEG
jgi:hypothetical protein